MRGGLALVLLVFVPCACVSRRPHVTPETEAALPSRAFVSLGSLADELNLYYRGEQSGYIELSDPPDNIVLVEGGRRALVNGQSVPLEAPCQLRGSEYVMASADAAKVSRTLEAIRSRREAARPAPRPEPRVARSTPYLRAEWRPPVKARPWTHIVIHHSAAERGDAAFIHLIHKHKGADGLGYHFVIGNGTLSGDGAVEVGYRWRKQIHGAHTRVRQGDDNRWNLYGIGICLVGDFRAHAPSRKQMDALVALVRELQATYDIPASRVVPHRAVKPTICPGPRFPWEELQARILKSP